MFRIICLFPVLGYSVIPGIEIFARIAKLHAPQPSDTDVPPELRSLISAMIISGDIGDDDNFVASLSTGFILSDLADVFIEAIHGSVTSDQRSALRAYIAEKAEQLREAIWRENREAMNDMGLVIQQASQAFRDQFIWLRELCDHVFRMYVNGHHVTVSEPIIQLYTNEFLSHLIFMEGVLNSMDPFHASLMLQFPLGNIQNRVYSVIGSNANPSTAYAIYVALDRCYGTLMERRTAWDFAEADAVKADFVNQGNSELHIQLNAWERISARLERVSA